MAPTSHQAPLSGSIEDDTRRSFSFGLECSTHSAWTVIAREAIDCVQWLRGIDPIKCVVVDLDNTLWSGNASDPEFCLTDGPAYESIRYGRHGGLHEALSALRARGILLATCSRNSHDGVMDRWRRLGPRRPPTNKISSEPKWGEEIDEVDFLLRPDDFVCHRISWKAKSEGILSIAKELGISLRSILFIDDNPIELAEVARTLPEVQVLGPDVELARYTLLTDPRLDPRIDSPAARSRTETTTAMLRREATRSEFGDGSAFLASLSIRVRVRPVARTDRTLLERIAELVARTTQFNTTGLVLDVQAIGGWLERRGVRLFTLEVADRFADYGLVGACLLSPGRVEQVVLSCRVIGLEVGVPFLVHALRRAEVHGPIQAVVRPTDRNLPCQGLFPAAGFQEAAPFTYVLAEIAHLPSPSPEIYAPWE